MIHVIFFVKICAKVGAAMARGQQVHFLWDPDRKSAFERVAQELRYSHTELARIILEEFVACYLNDEELKSLGMADRRGSREHGLMSQAIERYKAAIELQASRLAAAETLAPQLEIDKRRVEQMAAEEETFERSASKRVKRASGAPLGKKKGGK
jgi:hypothetical protein